MEASQMGQLIRGVRRAQGLRQDQLAAAAGVGVRLELAPLYDLVSTVAYPELDPAFAMRVGARATLENLRVGGWDRFAGAAGLGAPFVRRRVAELAKCLTLVPDESVRRSTQYGRGTGAVTISTRNRQRHNHVLRHTPVIRTRAVDAARCRTHPIVCRLRRSRTRRSCAALVS